MEKIKNFFAGLDERHYKLGACVAVVVLVCVACWFVPLTAPVGFALGHVTAIAAFMFCYYLERVNTGMHLMWVRIPVDAGKLEGKDN